MLRAGGKIAFYTIFTSRDLTEAEYQRVVDLGDPPWAAIRVEHSELLRSAGFVGIEEIDVTPDYLRTTRGWYEARERHANRLRELEGGEEFAKGQENRRLRIQAAEAGLLRRSLFVARRVTAGLSSQAGM